MKEETIEELEQRLHKIEEFFRNEYSIESAYDCQPLFEEMRILKKRIAKKSKVNSLLDFFNNSPRLRRQGRK